MFKLFVVLFVCVSVILNVNSRQVPYTPCPNLFNYYETPHHEVYGAMKFRNDLSGEYRLEVNMSIALVTNKVNYNN